MTFAALNSHTAILRRQLKPFGVRAVAIEPSWVDTAILDPIKNKSLDISTSAALLGKSPKVLGYRRRSWDLEKEIAY